MEFVKKDISVKLKEEILWKAYFVIHTVMKVVK